VTKQIDLKRADMNGNIACYSIIALINMFDSSSFAHFQF